MGGILAHGAGADFATKTALADSAHRRVTGQRTRACNGGNTYSFVSSYIDSTYYISLVSSFARRFEFEVVCALARLTWRGQCVREKKERCLHKYELHVSHIGGFHVFV